MDRQESVAHQRLRLPSPCGQHGCATRFRGMNVSEFIAKVAPHIGSGSRQSHPTTTGGKLAVGAEKLVSLASGVGLLKSATSQRGWKRWGLLIAGGFLLYQMLAPRKDEAPPMRFRR